MTDYIKVFFIVLGYGIFMFLLGIMFYRDILRRKWYVDFRGC